MTTEEIDQLKILAKRYYPKDTRYKDPLSNTNKNTNGYEFSYYTGHGDHSEWLTDGNGGCVYYNGKWSLINGIDPTTNDELEKARAIIYED